MTRVSLLFSSLSFVRIDLVLTFSRLLSLLLQDIVPAALTKDKKKINDVEIEVSVAWQSTLYVTNFPEHSDDASIRELFGQVRPISLSSISPRTTLLTLLLAHLQFGTIFETRWPGKKFKGTRRFVYIQFLSPVSPSPSFPLFSCSKLGAESLNSRLVLRHRCSRTQRTRTRAWTRSPRRHLGSREEAATIGREGFGEGGRRHSDEQVCQEGRLDQTLQACTPHLASFFPFEQKQLTHQPIFLFSFDPSQYGTIKDIRMTLDADGNTRGAAFVEFEEEVRPLSTFLHESRRSLTPILSPLSQSSAKAALALNSFELKKRRIAVTLPDSRGHSGGGPKK